jgi:antitoxin VapB
MVVDTLVEVKGKRAALLEVAGRHGAQAVWLRRASSFAWATAGGDSHINTADSHGVASLLITPEQNYLITNNIEARRLEAEEGLVGQGWEMAITPWHAPLTGPETLCGGLTLAADGPAAGALDLGDDIARLRSALSPVEGDRYRELGRQCAAAMDAAIRRVEPGQTEHQIAGLLAGEAESRGVQAVVNLIATDERLLTVRHPLPTGKRLDRYAMLILCGRWRGLIASVTRLVHFGRLPEAIRAKSQAVAGIDAAMIAATRVGATLGDVLTAAAQAYATAGFPDEWRHHHQGGSAGYEPREFFATPVSEEPILAGQAFAWNPSVSGAKSEDTILLGPSGVEVLTAIPGWPLLEPDGVRGGLQRPAILEIT